MAIYITIDGGTTNTRISLVKDCNVVQTLKFSVGARAGIGDNQLLKETVKAGISEILAENHLKESEIEKVLASGMITSEYGLVNLPHLFTPAGIKELAEGAFETTIPEITEIPFVFMRGVKTESDSLAETDMMRGEETELVGILQEKDGECVYILPGSHSKIITTDKNGKIISFTTMLTGEMTAALSENTILKGSLKLCDKFDEEYLLKGYEYCKEKGINEALFKVRILKNIFSASDEQVYSFFMGVILCGEISTVAEIKPSKIVIGGKKQLKEATRILLVNNLDCEIECVSDEKVDVSSSMGMIKIYEHKKNMKN